MWFSYQIDKYNLCAFFGLIIAPNTIKGRMLLYEQDDLQQTEK